MYCSFISCIITQLVRQLKVGVPSVTHLVPSVTKIEKVPQIISCLVIIDKNEPLADQQALGTKKPCLRVLGGFFGYSLRYQISKLSRQDFTQLWLPNASNHLRWVILKFWVTIPCFEALALFSRLRKEQIVGWMQNCPVRDVYTMQEYQMTPALCLVKMIAIQCPHLYSGVRCVFNIQQQS